MTTPLENIEVPLAALVDLAVECWRLERLLKMQPNNESSTTLRYSVRRLRRFVQEAGLSTLDLETQRYDPGLAVDVIGVETAEASFPPDTVIVETVSPIVTWKGQVVRYGQVVLAPETSASERRE